MTGRNASAQLREIALRLRAAGDGALFNSVRAEIRAEARPLVDAVHQAALDRLPKSGGLNEYVAAQHVTISTRTGPRTAGVRLTGPKKIRSGGQTNKGYVRHPTRKGPGWEDVNREKWRTTEYPPMAGWWTDTLSERSPAVTVRIVGVIDRVNTWIQAG